MTDIDQFRELLNGKTSSISTNQVIPQEHKPDYNHWTGIIVNNIDPDKQGKVQIKIYGYYDELSLNNIPWAIPDLNSFTSQYGNFIVPEINTIVRGYFDQGDIQKPIYNALAFNKSYNDEYDNYRNFSIIDEDYPHTMILFQTNNKDYLIMNKKTGEISFTHHNGAITKIDPDGNISVDTRACTLIHDFSKIEAGEFPETGQLNINVNGSVNITTNSTVNIKAKQNVNINSVLGNINLGNNPLKQNVNNIPNCFICGALHSVGNTQVKA